MKPEIKLIVFDIAGTTVQDDGAITIAFQRALQEWGYYVPEEEINFLMGYKKPEAIRMMLQEYEPNEDRITDRFVARIHERFQELMVAHYRTAPIVPMSSAAALFSRLKSMGIRVALNTGFSVRITTVILERLGWLENGLVADVVSSDEVEAGRPQPFMIRELMRRAQITNPLQVVKVGDTEVDVNEGINAGCLYSVAVTTGAFTREQLLPYRPSLIIDSLEELTTIIEQPVTIV